MAPKKENEGGAKRKPRGTPALKVHVNTRTFNLGGSQWWKRRGKRPGIATREGRRVGRGGELRIGRREGEEGRGEEVFVGC